VGEALIRHLGADGRRDPSHQMLADDSSESLSTVKRALEVLRGCGLGPAHRARGRPRLRRPRTADVERLHAHARKPARDLRPRPQSSN
jgi:hypothetical protein